jgi:zeta-carotene desaturase
MAVHSAAMQTPPTLADSPTASTAIVVGGGLSGMSAAVRLAEQGVRVQVLEAGKQLGGRATSYADPQSGELIDHTQHVFNHACTALLDFYDRLGVARKVHWERTLHLADGGVLDAWRADDLPAPLHLLRPLMRLKLFTRSEKWAIVRGMVAAMQVGQRGRSLLHDVPFDQWLADHGQSERVIDRFWSMLTGMTCYAPAERVSAAYGVMAAQLGLLHHERDYELGVANVPLASMYGPAAEAVEAAGGVVSLSTRVTRLAIDHGQVVGVELADGGKLDADVYVLALPVKATRAVVGDAAAGDARFARLAELPHEPIIGVHMFFEKAGFDCNDARAGELVMQRPHLALIDSPMHWLFNKGYIEEEDRSTAGRCGQHLQGVICGDAKLIDTSEQEIIDLAVREARRSLPLIAGATLHHAQAVKHPEAVISAGPGVESLRPAASGLIENLALSGDWTDTGWPATMESAVRSGYRAAEVALDHLRRPASLVPADSEPELLYRLMAG